jgi:uncharacterized PurR-regulated membrane protein YhhQ (DUF165 family)
MRIQWLRVLLGGFFIEVILIVVLVGGFMLAGVELANGVSLTSALIIGVGCFAAAFVVALWLGRGVASHVVLHGFLMGVVATLLYVGMVSGSGQWSSALAGYGPFTFVVLNSVRIVGAVVGGMVCERSRVARAVM